MNRRRILLVAAAVVAALGAALVLLYVRGAETRAEEKFDTVQVLRATQQIEAGETAEDALANGKIALEAVAQDQIIGGATDDGTLFQGKVALTPIYPGEQLLPVKFGGATDVVSASSLTIPEGQLAITVNLTDTARVAGFVNPGSEVAIFLSGTALAPTNEDFTRLLMPKVTVLGVGSTTQVTTTTTDETGAQTVEALPRTLFTLALNQQQVEKVLFAQGHGELAFGLLNEASQVKPGTGTTAIDLFDETP
ncbi:MAG: Flp pilus assembly protein CpaB [Nocardioides sp.]